MYFTDLFFFSIQALGVAYVVFSRSMIPEEESKGGEGERGGEASVAEFRNHQLFSHQRSPYILFLFCVVGWSVLLVTGTCVCDVFSRE